MERLGQIPSPDALRWKHGIFGLMERWGVEPGDLMKSPASR